MNTENKQKLFKAALGSFIGHDKTEGNVSREYWCEYVGLYRAINIMGLEKEFLQYCKQYGWDVMLP